MPPRVELAVERPPAACLPRPICAPEALELEHCVVAQDALQGGQSREDDATVARRGMGSKGQDVAGFAVGRVQKEAAVAITAQALWIASTQERSGDRGQTKKKKKHSASASRAFRWTAVGGGGWGARATALGHAQGGARRRRREEAQPPVAVFRIRVAVQELPEGRAQLLVRRCACQDRVSVVPFSTLLAGDVGPSITTEDTRCQMRVDGGVAS